MKLVRSRLLAIPIFLLLGSPLRTAAEPGFAALAYSFRTHLDRLFDAANARSPIVMESSDQIQHYIVHHRTRSGIGDTSQILRDPFEVLESSLGMFHGLGIKGCIAHPRSTILVRIHPIYGRLKQAIGDGEINLRQSLRISFLSRGHCTSPDCWDSDSACRVEIILNSACRSEDRLLNPEIRLWNCVAPTLQEFLRLNTCLGFTKPTSHDASAIIQQYGNCGGVSPSTDTGGTWGTSQLSAMSAWLAAIIIQHRTTGDAQ